MPYSQGWYYKEDLRRRRARDSELNNVAKEVAAVYHAVDPSIVAELTAPTRKHLEGPYSKVRHVCTANLFQLILALVPPRVRARGRSGCATLLALTAECRRRAGDDTHAPIGHTEDQRPHVRGTEGHPGCSRCSHHQ